MVGWSGLRRRGEYARNNGGPFADHHCPRAQWLSKMTAFGVPRTVLAGENGARRFDHLSTLSVVSLLFFD